MRIEAGLLVAQDVELGLHLGGDAEGRPCPVRGERAVDRDRRGDREQQLDGRPPLLAELVGEQVDQDHWAHTLEASPIATASDGAQASISWTFTRLSATRRPSSGFHVRVERPVACSMNDTVPGASTPPPESRISSTRRPSRFST